MAQEVRVDAERVVRLSFVDGLFGKDVIGVLVDASQLVVKSSRVAVIPGIEGLYFYRCPLTSSLDSGWRLLRPPEYWQIASSQAQRQKLH